MRKSLMTVVLVAATTVGYAQNELGTLTIQPKGGFGFATLTNVDKAEMAGVGISYEFSHVVIDARYLLGLTKVNKNGDKTCRNSVILITTGYKFNL